MEYFAFGETFLEEHSNADRTPYLYNGKELDEETGLYYYGARYYDAKTSIWQSVDPLAEMYPGWSPYAYTMQNPLRYVDPTGMSTEDSSGGCGCPEPPCGDKKLYPFTAGKQQLPEVIVDAPGKSNSKSRSSNKNYSSSMSFSGEMPHYLKYRENPVTWDSPYESGTLDQYNEDWGTNYTEGNSWNQWYYDTKWKPQYDNLISNIHSAQLQVGLVTLSVPIAVIGGAEAAPILVGGIQNLYAASLSGYSASLSFGNTAYYAINVEANAIMETGDGLWSRYMLNIMGGAQTYMLPQYNFNIDVVGPTGNFIYGNLSGAPSLEVLFNH